MNCVWVDYVFSSRMLIHRRETWHWANLVPHWTRLICARYIELQICEACDTAMIMGVFGAGLILGIDT